MSIHSSLIAFCLILAAASTSAWGQDCNINSVCFAIDMSGSIDGSEYPKEINAVVEISRTIGKLSAITSYSAHGFASSTSLVSAPTKDLDSGFIPALKSFKRINGGTNIRAGLGACFSTIGAARGERVVVLLTDGNDGGSALSEAMKIKNAGVSIVTVGIGNGINVNYLKTLADSPDFFVQANFGNLVSKTKLITKAICNSGGPKPSEACKKAYNDCDFAIDGASVVPTIALGMADKALTSKIVSRKRGERVGIVNANGGPAEFILDNGLAEPITKFGKQRFSPNTFKPYTIRGMVSFSGIGHQTLQSDQAKVARGKCVRTFLTNYQLLEPGADGFVMGNVNIRKNRKKCVVVFLV